MILYSYVILFGKSMSRSIQVGLEVSGIVVFILQFFELQYIVT